MRSEGDRPGATADPKETPGSTPPMQSLQKPEEEQRQTVFGFVIFWAIMFMFIGGLVVMVARSFQGDGVGVPP